MKESTRLTLLVAIASILGGCQSTAGLEGGNGTPDAGSMQDGAAAATCAALATFRVASEGATEIDLSWTAEPGVSFSLQRKSYCGTDGYQLLAMLAAGTSTYADKDVQPNWVYWYELTATDAAGNASSSALDVQAATGGVPGCGTSSPQPSAVIATCGGVAASDAGAGSDAAIGPEGGTGSDAAVPTAAGCGGSSLPTPGGPAPTVANTTVLHPGDDVPSAVTACGGGAVHFSAGTYTVNESVHVPSNCTLQGEPGGVSIITGDGGPNGQSGGIFDLGSTNGVTVASLHFDHSSAECLYGNSALAKNIHIVGNWFSNMTADGAIFLYNIEDTVIEQNIFENVSGDGMHLEFFSGGNTTARWNFGAGIGGEALVEAQNAPSGLLVCQNVFYSKTIGENNGTGLSIATGGVDGGGVGATDVVLEGNIILDENQPTVNSSNASQWDAMEVMGTTPTVQNNFVRHWGAGALFANVTGTPVITGNTFCATGYVYPIGTEPGWNSSIASLPSMSQVAMTNTIAASCNGVVIPPLPSPVRVPPDLLTNGALPLPDGTTWTPTAPL